MPAAGDCPFCDRIAAGQYLLSSRAAETWVPGRLVVAFEPLSPVVPGHTLVVPAAHVRDALESPEVTGAVFAYAALLAGLAAPQCNLITSAGLDATQSVFHLHVHIVPRRQGDGLKLPWTDQLRECPGARVSPAGESFPERSWPV
jgi:histidine triad (HIT) family protein